MNNTVAVGHVYISNSVGSTCVLVIVINVHTMDDWFARKNKLISTVTGVIWIYNPNKTHVGKFIQVRLLTKNSSQNKYKYYSLNQNERM